ncbi:MAG TPA: sulfite exporter TauE/SafE family protein [Tenuifilaceae bacterium]|nr:sulfite exporter TauE/SafE family protein [Tenuifilaceae bacterium]
MSSTTLVALIIIGLVTGVVTGLTGSSGVMIVVPLVNMLLGIPIHESIGISLIVNVIAPIAISYTYFKNGNIDVRVGVWIALGSIFGAQIGAFFADQIPETGLGGSFGIFIILMGILICIKGFRGKKLESTKPVLEFKTEKRKNMAIFMLGFAIGIISGVFGAGGGGMILLILVFVLNFPIRVAIGTSSLLMAITSFSGALGYFIHGNIRLVPGLVMGSGAALSGVVSARFANRVNEDILSIAVGVVFFMLGTLMILIA